MGLHGMYDCSQICMCTRAVPVKQTNAISRCFLFTGVFGLFGVRVVMWEGDPPHAWGEGDRVVLPEQGMDITEGSLCDISKARFREMGAFGAVLKK